MPLTFKTRLSSNIIDFPYSPITKLKIEDFLQTLLLKIANTSDNDWQVILQISPNRIEWLENSAIQAVGIYKKGLNQLAEKEKIFTIVIPIPTKLDIDWGLPKKNFVFRPKAQAEKFALYEVDYHLFNNLDEYVIHCVKMSVEPFLQQGITVNKKKYKL